jgi:hypothetical protein
VSTAADKKSNITTTHDHPSGATPGGARRSGRGADDDAALSQLLTHWAEGAFPGNEVNQTFLRVEFEDRLNSYRKSARGWRTAEISLWGLVTVLGLLISILAGLKTGQNFTLVVGALIALLTTLTNTLHPSKQADGYEDARLALRDQGWLLLHGSDSYTGKHANAQFHQFTQQIRQIVKLKRATTRFSLGAASSNGSNHT